MTMVSRGGRQNNLVYKSNLGRVMVTLPKLFLNQWFIFNGASINLSIAIVTRITFFDHA